MAANVQQWQILVYVLSKIISKHIFIFTLSDDGCWLFCNQQCKFLKSFKVPFLYQLLWNLYLNGRTLFKSYYMIVSLLILVHTIFSTVGVDHLSLWELICPKSLPRLIHGPKLWYYCHSASRKMTLNWIRSK